MPVDLILPVSITFSIAAWTLILHWYVHPVIKKYPKEKAIAPFL